MKKLIPYILMLIVLFVGVFVGYMIKDDIEKDKSFNKYAITIGDTTMQVISGFRVQGEPEKLMHIIHLEKGKNEDYCQLDENTGLFIIVMK